MMTRVFVEDAYGSIPDGGADDKRLDVLLDNWAEWMKSGSYGRGLPTKSPGLRSLGGTDSVEMNVSIDLRLARAIDAIIDSLPQNEQIAVIRSKGLQKADVWRLREPYDVLVTRARILIRELMRKRRVE